MVYSLQIPKEEREQFKELLKEAKELCGASYYRIVLDALKYYIIYLRKSKF